MSFLKIANTALSQFNLLKNRPITVGTVFFVNSERHFRKNYGRHLRVMKARRSIIGPERIRRRNEWSDWNYKSEIFAFGQRLNEKISEDTLRWVFIHDSFVEKEIQKRKDLDLAPGDTELDLKSNAELIASGHEIISKFVRKYITLGYPKLPEEGIEALHRYLTSEEVLSHVSFNIGTSELIYCSEYPPEKSTLADSLKAVIGGIANDDSVSRADNFVLDFICPQLVAKDVFEIWDLENPVEVLNEILRTHGHEECEPRLISESGRNTIESVYNVGLYSNRVFLGRAPGETVDVAVEMAAYDALRKCFRIRENESPLDFGERVKTLDLLSIQKPLSVNSWYCEDLKSDLNSYLFALNK